jgi:hypothetical protein
MRRVREPKFKRRIIESRAERDAVRGEHKDRMDRLADETKAAKVKQTEVDALRDSQAVDVTTGEAYSPPRALHEFMELVQAAHPGWGWASRHKLAMSMYKRHEVVEKAFQDGFRMLRDLRERQDHGIGWWWESLRPLAPIERSQVCIALRGILQRSRV